MSKIIKSKIPFLVVFCCFLGLNSCITRKPLLEKVGDTSEVDVLKNAHVSYIFKDIATNKIIAQKDADKLYTPASNIKLLTLYSVLKVYPDSLPSGWTYETNDSLIFIPSGDPSFLYKDFNDDKLTNRLKNNSKSVLYVSVPPNDNKVYGPGWAWDDDGKLFQSGRFPFSIYGGKISVSKEENYGVEVPGTFFDESFVYLPNGRVSEQISLRKKSFSNQIELSRKINRNDEFSLNFSFFPTGELCSDLLQDTFGKTVELSYYVPEKKFRKAFYHSSAPLIVEMMHYSDNHIAEQLMYMIGYEAEGEYSVNKGIKFSTTNIFKDFDLDNTVWIDGSGLSRYNKSSPKVMANLVEKMINEYGIKTMKTYLPAGGRDGNIANFYWSDPPYIWAKTGSMKGVYTLTGIMKTTEGKDLVFSIMINNSQGSRLQIIKQVEKVLKNIRDKKDFKSYLKSLGLF